jgi:hypothetical protein
VAAAPAVRSAPEAPSPADQAIQVFRVASPLDIDLRCGAVDLAKIVRCQLDFRCANVFLEAL